MGTVPEGMPRGGRCHSSSDKGSYLGAEGGGGGGNDDTPPDDACLACCCGGGKGEDEIFGALVAEAAVVMVRLGGDTVAEDAPGVGVAGEAWLETESGLADSSMTISPGDPGESGSSASPSLTFFRGLSSMWLMVSPPSGRFKPTPPSFFFISSAILFLT